MSPCHEGRFRNVFEALPCRRAFPVHPRARKTSLNLCDMRPPSIREASYRCAQGLRFSASTHSLLAFLPPLSQGDGVLHEDFQPCASRALWPGSASSIKCQVSATWLFPLVVGERVGQGQNMGLGPAQQSLGWISVSVLLGREPLAGGTPGQHLEFALWLLPQSFPVSCHPRPSGTTTALLRHTGSASTDPTPGRRVWV